MSHSGDGAATTAAAAATVVGTTTSHGGGYVNPFSQFQRSRPLSIHIASSSDDSSSSNEIEGEDLNAKKRRKEKVKAKIKKRANKLMKKRIKEESEKHPFFGYYQVPPNYLPPSSQYPSSQFQSVHLGKPPYFDGTDYPKWAYDMKMQLYGLHPSIWKVVVFRNAQAVRVITSSLCAQEFNKVWSVEISNIIWDTLKEAHEGTDQVREGKMDLIHGELELFIMLEEEIVTQIFDRLMLLVSNIRTLGSMDWDDHKGTKVLNTTSSSSISSSISSNAQNELDGEE
uniref:Uncharacterized protein n=1 Tax=Setaria italica TaxID=4555 RepID=K4AJQ3_SETIT